MAKRVARIVGWSLLAAAMGVPVIAAMVILVTIVPWGLLWFAAIGGGIWLVEWADYGG